MKKYLLKMKISIIILFATFLGDIKIVKIALKKRMFSSAHEQGINKL